MHRIRKVSRLLLLAATALTVPGLTLAAGSAEQGTIAWISEATEAKEWLLMPFRGPSELVPRLERVLDLYRGCDECRIEIWKAVERRVRHEGDDPSLLLGFEELVYAHDDVRRGRILVETGRPDEAVKVVARALAEAQVVEERLALVEVMAEARRATGEDEEADRLTRELLRDMPIEPDHCERALEWWARLGEDSVDEGSVGDDATLRGERITAELARLDKIERTEDNDGYLSCLQNHWLLRADWVERSKKPARRAKGTAPVVRPERDIARRQEEVAEKTADPKIRASIFLSAAATVSRSTVQDRARFLRLIERARTTAPEPSIEVGALRMDLSLRDGAERGDRIDRVASTLISQFGEYEASWDACEYQWEKLAWSGKLREELPGWRDRCSARLGWSRNAGNRWMSVVRAVAPDSEGAEFVLAALAAMGPRPEVVPSLLLRRASAIGASDSDRAWQMTVEALRSPRFFLDRDDPLFPGDALATAEARGDFDTALYLQILDGRPAAGGGLPGEDSPSSWWEFRTAYYRVRLGIDVAVNWKTMLDRVPVDPAGPSALRWHSSEYLDRVVAAAAVASKQSEAILKLETLESKYLDVLAGLTPTPDGRSRAEWQPTVKDVTALLARCVRDLSDSRSRS